MKNLAIKIRVCTAWENYNKAILSNDILVHKVDAAINKAFWKLRKHGLPIFIDDFLIANEHVQDEPHKQWYLSGLNHICNTISFSETLKQGYQELIKLDERFLTYLKSINTKRNRLHFTRTIQVVLK